MFDNLRQDAARLAEVKGKPLARCVVEGVLFENGFQAVVLHRVAHWFRSRNIRFLGPFFARLNLFLTGVDISPGAVIGPGLYISHGTGLVIGGAAHLGRRAFLLQGVTIGAPTPARVAQMPTLGDDVFVGAGACIIGDIRVGSRVFIGVNAVVARDVPDDCKVLAAGGVEVTPRGGQEAAGLGRVEAGGKAGWPAERGAMGDSAAERAPRDPGGAGSPPGWAGQDAGTIEEVGLAGGLAGAESPGGAPTPEDTWDLGPGRRSRVAGKPAAGDAGEPAPVPSRPGGTSA